MKSFKLAPVFSQSTHVPVSLTARLYTVISPPYNNQTFLLVVLDPKSYKTDQLLAMKFGLRIAWHQKTKVGFVQCRSTFSKTSYESKRFESINCFIEYGFCQQADSGNFRSAIPLSNSWAWGGRHVARHPQPRYKLTSEISNRHLCPQGWYSAS